MEFEIAFEEWLTKKFPLYFYSSLKFFIAWILSFTFYSSSSNFYLFSLLIIRYFFYNSVSMLLTLLFYSFLVKDIDLPFYYSYLFFMPCIYYIIISMRFSSIFFSWLILAISASLLDFICYIYLHFPSIYCNCFSFVAKLDCSCLTFSLLAKSIFF